MAMAVYALVTMPERFALALLASLKRQSDESCARFRFTENYFACGLKLHGKALKFDPDEFSPDELNLSDFVRRLVRAGVLVALAPEQLPANVTLVDNWFAITPSLYTIEPLCVDDYDGEIPALDNPALPGFGPDDHPDMKSKPCAAKETDPGMLPIGDLPEALHDLAIRRDSAAAWLRYLDEWLIRDNEHTIGLLETEADTLRGKINNSKETLKELSYNTTSASHLRRIHIKSVEAAEAEVKRISEQLKPLRSRRASLANSRKRPECVLNALLRDIRTAHAKLSA